MKLTNEFEPIIDWAKQKGIYESGDVKTQLAKLVEETGELAKAILKKDEKEFIDAIGDCVVVLTNLAELGNKYYKRENVLQEWITIEKCINSAYDVIKDRTGKMNNGTFEKDDK